ncbi:MAG: hypothetical protein ABIH34_03115 [Nanoarchaeota archaeon]
MAKPRKKGIIIVAIIVSILLYAAGVLSGLYANRLIKQETEQGLQFLKNYIDLLDENLDSVQLEQAFTETLEPEQRCSFSTIAMDDLMQDLSFFWERLPFRIEEYERGRQLSEEYLQLKEDYTIISLRTWITAKSIYDSCNTEFIPVLYFYSRSCDVCVDQGKELDALKRTLDKEAMVFTIDIDADERIILRLQQFYNITQTPAIIIDGTVLQGRLYRAAEIMGAIS